MAAKKESNYLELLAVQVASGNTVKEAAAIVGCAEQTAYNFSCTEDFRKLVAKYRTEAITQAVNQLSNGASQAVSTLVELLKPSQEPSTRLNAAKAILANVGPVSELAELRARLDALEKAS